MNFQGYIWSIMAAGCVVVACAACAVRLHRLYLGPDLVLLVEQGGRQALRALGLEGDERAWRLSEFELDLEERLLAWAAAPRAAARVSTALGFLFAALAFRSILDTDLPDEGAALVLLAGVLRAIAPIFWGMVGLAAALTTDRLARARVQELRRAGARVMSLMCVPESALSAHDLGENGHSRVP